MKSNFDHPFYIESHIIGYIHIHTYIMLNTFSFREPEFYYQEQDQRSDENHFLNIYFRAFDYFNKSLSIIKYM